MKLPGIFIVIIFFLFSACEDPLRERTFDTLGPSNFYNSVEDAEALLTATYANSQGWPPMHRDLLTFGEFNTDISFHRQGAIESNTRPVEDFELSATHPWLDFFWDHYYSAILRANTVLDHVPDIEMNEDRKEQILAEARFLRAYNYFYLYDLFGPVPLIRSSETSVEDRPERASDEEFISFLEQEFRAAGEVLPATQSEFGRATSGAALGFLTKFHLNNKKWTEAASTAQEIIDSNVYAIFEGENRTNLFAMENEGNSEFIHVAPFKPDGNLGQSYINHAAPPGYKWEFQSKVNFAAQFKIRSEFLELFEPEDERLDAFVYEYENLAGETVVLGEDDVRSFKYPEDPEGVGARMGNDFPLLRYADILLSRAEALNEINGPNQESIELINEIREAAGVDDITLAEYPSKEGLRDFILDERAREFHTEALRRQDLIRHGKFIEMAQDRGKSAQDHHVLYPLPQEEVDKNPNLEQNPGY